MGFPYPVTEITCVTKRWKMLLFGDLFYLFTYLLIDLPIYLLFQLFFRHDHVFLPGVGFRPHSFHLCFPPQLGLQACTSISGLRPAF
jgi:hypothetical protein